MGNNEAVQPKIGLDLASRLETKLIQTTGTSTLSEALGQVIDPSTGKISQHGKTSAREIIAELLQDHTSSEVSNALRTELTELRGSHSESAKVIDRLGMSMKLGLFWHSVNDIRTSTIANNNPRAQDESVVAHAIRLTMLQHSNGNGEIEADNGRKSKAQVKAEERQALFEVADEISHRTERAVTRRTEELREQKVALAAAAGVTLASDTTASASSLDLHATTPTYEFGSVAPAEAFDVITYDIKTLGNKGIIADDGIVNTGPDTSDGGIQSSNSNFIPNAAALAVLNAQEPEPETASQVLTGPQLRRFNGFLERTLHLQIDNRIVMAVLFSLGCVLLIWVNRNSMVNILSETQRLQPIARSLASDIFNIQKEIQPQNSEYTYGLSDNERPEQNDISANLPLMKSQFEEPVAIADAIPTIDQETEANQIAPIDEKAEAEKLAAHTEAIAFAKSLAQDQAEIRDMKEGVKIIDELEQQRITAAVRDLNKIGMETVRAGDIISATMSVALPREPQDFYTGKDDNALNGVNDGNENMSRIGSLTPGQLYGLLNDGILDPDRPGYVMATYMLDGIKHEYRGSGICGPSSALGLCQDELNSRIAESGLDIPQAIVFRNGSKTNNNTPHPKAYVSYTPIEDRGNKSDWNAGYTIFDGGTNPKTNEVEGTDYISGLSREFYEYWEKRGFHVEMFFQWGYYMPDDTPDVVVPFHKDDSEYNTRMDAIGNGNPTIVGVVALRLTPIEGFQPSPNSVDDNSPNLAFTQTETETLNWQSGNATNGAEIVYHDKEQEELILAEP